jgi:hypothetical protein
LDDFLFCGIAKQCSFDAKRTAASADRRRRRTKAVCLPAPARQARPCLEFVTLLGAVRPPKPDPGIPWSSARDIRNFAPERLYGGDIVQMRHQTNAIILTHLTRAQG